MKNRQKGVLGSSDIYIHIPSEFARHALFYVEMVGDYQCTEDFYIRRSAFDMYVLFWVRAGSMHFSTAAGEFDACGNSVVLLECRSPHRFFVNGWCDFSWIHVNGAASADYYRLLQQSGRLLLVYQGEPACAPFFCRIIDGMHGMMVNEHQISADIHQIFSCLADTAFVCNGVLRMESAVVSGAVDYMEAHYDQSLSIEGLAAQFNISPSYFARLFKRTMFQTPYDFLTATRIYHAKTMLLDARLTIDSIALACGFHSASNFIHAFKKRTGMTPTQFRRMGF